jgi:vancomycin resistance protein YoaR
MGGWSPGLDAAIVQDLDVPQYSTDLRFTNPTGSWLMITAETDGDRLLVEIWGEDTGYEVTYSEPDVWVAYGAPDDVTVMVDDQLPPGTMNRQEPLDGLGVSITRNVYDRNGMLVLSDTWQTTYYATGPIIRVSPDMEEHALANSG